MFNRMESEEFKRRMRVARAHGGLRSQSELAERLKARGTIRGLGRATLDKLENGREQPTDDQLRVIASACGVPKRYLDDASFDPFAVELISAVVVTGDTATVTHGDGATEVMSAEEAREKGWISEPPPNESHLPSGPNQRQAGRSSGAQGR